MREEIEFWERKKRRK